MARPTTYDPKFCDMLIEHMSQGLSLESFAGVVGVCEDTVYEWAKVHPAFSEAKKQGRAKSRLIWEKIGMNGTVGKIKGYDAGSWIFNMKNRFRWRDRHDEDDKPRQPFVFAYEVKKKKKKDE